MNDTNLGKVLQYANERDLEELHKKMNDDLSYLKAHLPGEFTKKFMDTAHLMNLKVDVGFFDVIRYVAWFLETLSSRPRLLQGDQRRVRAIFMDLVTYLNYLIGTKLTLPSKFGVERPNICWNSFKQ